CFLSGSDIMPGGRAQPAVRSSRTRPLCVPVLSCFVFVVCVVCVVGNAADLAPLNPHNASVRPSSDEQHWAPVLAPGSDPGSGPGFGLGLAGAETSGPRLSGPRESGFVAVHIAAELPAASADC